jgi:hypothetical protein
MAKKSDFHKVIIGRAESINFVDAQINDVPAKVDTGAYRNAIHASNIRVEDGVLVFDLFSNHPLCGSLGHEISTQDFEIVGVRNSFGHREDRYEIKLKVKVGPKIFTTAFTLADRSKMIYPILLGRKLLNGRFLVDTEKAGVDRAKLKKDYAIAFPEDEEDGRDEK